MMFEITFKDPDCAVLCANKDIDYVDELPDEARELAAQFLEFSEYVTILFDTADGTAVVKRS